MAGDEFECWHFAQQGAQLRGVIGTEMPVRLLRVSAPGGGDAQAGAQFFQAGMRISGPGARVADDLRFSTLCDPAFMLKAAAVVVREMQAEEE